MNISIDQREIDFNVLLGFILDLGNVLKGNDAPDVKYNEAEGLATKFVNHCISAVYIFKGVKLDDYDYHGQRISFFDPPSLNIIARAAFEAFLIFDFVYTHPVSEQELEFRYLCWKLSGLSLRQDLPEFTEDIKNKKLSEQPIISSILDKLYNTDYFLGLAEAKKRKIQHHLQTRFNTFHKNWKTFCSANNTSWQSLAEQSGFGMNNIGYYKFLCDHAHSGSLSALQTEQAMNAILQKNLCNSSMNLVLICMAFFIKTFSKLLLDIGFNFQINFESDTTYQKWMKNGEF